MSWFWSLPLLLLFTLSWQIILIALRFLFFAMPRPLDSVCLCCCAAIIITRHAATQSKHYLCKITQLNWSGSDEGLQDQCTGLIGCTRPRVVDEEQKPKANSKKEKFKQFLLPYPRVWADVQLPTLNSQLSNLESQSLSLGPAPHAC